MKEFEFQVSVKCTNDREANKLLQLLYKLGYVHLEDKTNPFGENPIYITTGVYGISNHLSIGNYPSIESGVFVITDFNLDLIEDIVSVRCGKTWVKGEPYVRIYKSSRHYNKGGPWGIFDSTGLEVANTNKRRPRIDEICDYHGYYIDGNDIIKNGYISNNSEHYVYNFNGYADNNIEKNAITMLRYVEAKTGCKYSLTKTETTETKLL